MIKRLVSAAALVALATSASAAQAVVDAGTFTISVRGDRVGREDFSIRSAAPGGAEAYVAQGTVAYSDRRLSPKLSTDAAGSPVNYYLEVKSGEGQEVLSGIVGRGRISVRSKSPRGESAKEYIIGDGAVVLDDDVFHQYYFVGRRKSAGSVPVVVPQRNGQMMMRVTSKGAERVTVGGRALDAEHLVLTDGAAGERDLWIDAAGRVLKIAIPSKGIVALRDDPPA